MTGSFKKRWSAHESNFRLKQKKTTLSAHVCKLEEEGKQYTIKWDIMDRAPVYNPVTRKCRLCLKEIFYILFRPDSASLNNRSELFNTCRHRKQKLLERAWRSKLFPFWYRNLVITIQLAIVHFLLMSVVNFHMKQICKGYENYLDLWNIILWKIVILYNFLTNLYEFP